MSWSLSASGHADNPDDEKILAAQIGQVLAKAGKACSYAQFGGSGYNGDPREVPVQLVDGDEGA